MERWEIEARLNRSRASLLETYAAMSAAERSRPATNSALNAEVEWTAGDHFLHIIDPEQQIVEAIRRQVAGEEFPYPVLFDAEGNRLSSDVFLPIIHARNDTWLADHHDLTFDQIVALGAEVRARVLKLLSELTVEQLAEPLRNMPWSVFAANIGELFMLVAQHGESHYSQAIKGVEARSAPA
ncbi:MAG TPA: DinB family protein [Tepidiformaceae bacterium]|nr:DinB family protein [Tepidiformaceae bacterium]